MAIKNIIAAGIGFTPGSVKFIPTRGFIAGAVATDRGPLFQLTDLLALDPTAEIKVRLLIKVGG